MYETWEELEESIKECNKCKLCAEYGITNSRGKWVEKNGIWYMPTFHPAALFRDESKKIDFWRDLKLVKEKLIISRRKIEK